MKLVESSICRFCGEEDESTIHLTSCPRLYWLANEAFNMEDIHKPRVWIRRLHWFISQPPLVDLMQADYDAPLGQVDATS